MKNPEFSQPTPEMQYASILMGFDGQVMMLEIDKTQNLDQRIKDLREYVELFRQLLPYILKKEKW